MDSPALPWSRTITMGGMDEAGEHVTGRPLLLLVDDDALLRNATALWLGRADLVPVHAANLSEARCLVEQLGADIQVAVIDHVLPDGSGREIVECLRRRNAGARILVYTGFVDRASRELAGIEGVGLIPKGRDPRYIRQAVELAAELVLPLVEPRVGDLPPLELAGRPLPAGWFGWALPRRLEHLRYQHDLSLKELDVALAAARGESNPDTAAELSISRGTVKARLASVYRKLGLTDRAQLRLLLA